MAVFRPEYGKLSGNEAQGRPLPRFHQSETDVLAFVVVEQRRHPVRRRPSDDLLAGEDVLQVDVLAMVFELRRIEVGGPIPLENGEDALPLQGNVAVRQVEKVRSTQEIDGLPHRVRHR